MNKQERQKYVVAEIEAIYEEVDNSINQLILARKFLKNLVDVAKGAEPEYKNLVQIINKLKKDSAD